MTMTKKHVTFPYLSVSTRKFVTVLAATAALLFMPHANAGGAIEVSVDDSFGAASTKIFPSESVRIKAEYNDPQEDQTVHKWKAWIPELNEDEPNDDHSGGNAGINTSRTISGNMAEPGESLKVYFDAVVSGDKQPNPPQPKTVEIVNGNIKLTASEDIVKADSDSPPSITLTAKLQGAPNNDLTYTFYAGNNAIHTSDPTTQTSYSIDLSSESDMGVGKTYGSAAAAARFRVETSRPSDYPLPEGSGDGGAPLDDDHPPVANEVDVVYFTATITIFAEQPKPGFRDAFVPVEGSLIPSIGHAFWRISIAPASIVDTVDPDLSVYNGFSRGFYPEPGLLDETNAFESVPGQLRIDEGSPWTARHTYEIESLMSGIAGLTYTRELDGDNSEYNLASMNCADAPIQAAAACGVSVPDTTQAIFGKEITNPGDLGEDLIQDGGIRNTD